MRTQKRSGFTIIEVMLFLAITGALTVAILVGSGAAIGQQRYRDSVNSFKGLIQEQYGQIANVINSEVDKPACTDATDTLSFSDKSQQYRGTSNCLIIGRFLLIQPTEVTAYNVIGLPPEFPDKNKGDSDLLKSYAVAVDTTQLAETYEIGWGARIVWPKSVESTEGANGVTAGVLIVRSPLSGSILTYVKNLKDGMVGDDAVLSALIGSMIDDTAMVQKDFCVDPDGSLSTRRRQAVRINARAANQSAIEIPLEGSNVCS